MLGRLGIVVLLVTETVMATGPPNVVVILTDDQGWGDTGYNCGQPGSVAYSKRNLTSCPHTPHIDALATGPHSVLFHRFYSGAGVCSPTRASVLTGRNNKRGCIDSALPCDHMASMAGDCSQGPGLAHSEFTIADAAAKAGMKTLHLGKWHLGDLWNKFDHNPPIQSNPSDHGFSEWFTSQAQLPTATPNCGCFPPLDWNGPLAPADWPASWNDSNIYPNVKKFRHDYPGRHCIIAGGQFVDESFVCSTYWHPDPSSSSGVANITEKIEGSDGDFFVDKMQTFVHESIAESKQWLAVLMLHYIHLPHPAMPTYFEKRKDSKDPDYIGTLQQLDDTIGELVSVLKTAEVWNDTLLFYTSDNGAHCNESPADVMCGGINTGRSTGGVRGCKASAFEGGIRVPGFLVWPSKIKTHRETWVPAVTHDFLPTIMEALGVQSDRPSYALDGISLFPFIAATMDSQVPTARPKPIGFWWGSSMVWMDNDMKLTNAQSPGQGCVAEPPWLTPSESGMRLFNLTADHTESIDLASSHSGIYASMSEDLTAWMASVQHSMVAESHCSEL